MKSKSLLRNEQGFGVVELAAWIVVTAFVVKIVAAGVIGVAVLSADKRSTNLDGYRETHLALRNDDAVLYEFRDMQAWKNEMNKRLDELDASFR